VAIVSRSQRSMLTYRDLALQTTALGLGLSSLGFSPGSSLAMCLPNSEANILTQLAASIASVSVATVKVRSAPLTPPLSQTAPFVHTAPPFVRTCVWHRSPFVHTCVRLVFDMCVAKREPLIPSLVVHLLNQASFPSYQTSLTLASLTLASLTLASLTLASLTLASLTLASLTLASLTLATLTLASLTLASLAGSLRHPDCAGKAELRGLDQRYKRGNHDHRRTRESVHGHID